MIFIHLSIKIQFVISFDSKSLYNSFIWPLFYSQFFVFISSCILNRLYISLISLSPI